MMDKQESFSELQLQRRISELEKQLKEAKMKAIAYSAMIEIAEKSLTFSSKKSTIPNHRK